MEKTKIGIPAALLAAVMWLLGYYGGYVVVAVVVGYVLLMENSAMLKRTAAKVLLFMLVFSLLNTIIYLIPNILSLFHDLVCIFDPYAFGEKFYNNFFTRFIEFVSSGVSMVKMLVFLLMGGISLFGKEVKIPMLDNYLDKHLNQ